MYLSSICESFRPVRIYWYLPEFIYNIIAKTLTSNTHLGTPSFVSSPRQSKNKSESSNYTANGDLTIKSVFVNIVSSAILNSQAGYRCTPVPRSPFPVPRSPFPVPSFSNILLILPFQLYRVTASVKSENSANSAQTMGKFRYGP